MTFNHEREEKQTNFRFIWLYSFLNIHAFTCNSFSLLVLSCVSPFMKPIWLLRMQTSNAKTKQTAVSVLVLPEVLIWFSVLHPLSCVLSIFIHYHRLPHLKWFRIFCCQNWLTELLFSFQIHHKHNNTFASKMKFVAFYSHTRIHTQPLRLWKRTDVFVGISPFLESFDSIFQQFRSIVTFSLSPLTAKIRELALTHAHKMRIIKIHFERNRFLLFAFDSFLSFVLALFPLFHCLSISFQ